MRKKRKVVFYTFILLILSLSLYGCGGVSQLISDGNELVSQGDYEKAIKKYEKAEKKAPERRKGEIYEGLVVAYASTGEYEKAHDYYELLSESYVTEADYLKQTILENCNRLVLVTLPQLSVSDKSSIPVEELKRGMSLSDFPETAEKGTFFGELYDGVVDNYREFIGIYNLARAMGYDDIILWGDFDNIVLADNSVVDNNVFGIYSVGGPEDEELEFGSPYPDAEEYEAADDYVMDYPADPTEGEPQLDNKDELDYLNSDSSAVDAETSTPEVIENDYPIRSALDPEIVGYYGGENFGFEVVDGDTPKVLFDFGEQGPMVRVDEYNDGYGVYTVDTGLALYRISFYWVDSDQYMGASLEVDNGDENGFMYMGEFSFY